MANEAELVKWLLQFKVMGRKGKYICAAVGCQMRVIKKNGICAWCRLDSGRRV